MSNKTYLGDGLYVNFDGYQLMVSAENGVVATDTVYMEPNVLVALLRFAGQHFNTEPLIRALKEGEQLR